MVSFFCKKAAKPSKITLAPEKEISRKIQWRGTLSIYTIVSSLRSPSFRFVSSFMRIRSSFLRTAFTFASKSVPRISIKSSGGLCV